MTPGADPAATNQKLRVAVMIETYLPFVNGMVTHVQCLRAGLEELGHEVLIVAADPDIKHHELSDGVLRCPGIRLKGIYGYGLANPASPRTLRAIKEFNPDIIHVHTEYGCGQAGLISARRLQIPLVYTLHTMYDEYLHYIIGARQLKLARKAMHAIIRRIAKRATRVIGPANKTERYLRACGYEGEVTVVPNSVDTSAFHPGAVAPELVERARAELGISADDICLCFVGRLGSEKSVDILIRWFSIAAGQDERLRLFIIGEGPESEALARLTEQLGAQNQVRLLGKIPHAEIPPYYQACDLFATASTTEMNSISFLEANASGLYSLQRYDPETADQITVGENGDFYATAGEFQELLERYAGLSSAERTQLRNAVAERTARYGQAEFTARVLGIYQDAVAEYRASAR